MKLIDGAKDLKGYRLVMTLPSFDVYEHPTTFHTYIISHRKTKYMDKLLVVAEGVWPGLRDDLPVTIPAGMWREMVRGLNQRSGGNWVYAPPPPPRDRALEEEPNIPPEPQYHNPLRAIYRNAQNYFQPPAFAEILQNP